MVTTVEIAIRWTGFDNVHSNFYAAINGSLTFIGELEGSACSASHVDSDGDVIIKRRSFTPNISVRVLYVRTAAAFKEISAPHVTRSKRLEIQ